jgi:putative chitinase
MFKWISDWLDVLFSESNEECRPMILYDDLFVINGEVNSEDCKYYLNAFNEILPIEGIDTTLRLSHFLSQVIHESGHFKYKSENLNYSAKALRSVFGKYFKTDAIANEYARKPEKIANRVYANRMGNGDENSGDGWKYRGRGLIQLTGADNYKRCGEALGLDLISNPDLIINDPDVCVKSACWFWNSKNLNNYADNDDCVSITKKINGGLNGIDDRKKILTIAKQTLFE